MLGTGLAKKAKKIKCRLDWTIILNEGRAKTPTTMAPWIILYKEKQQNINDWVICMI